MKKYLIAATMVLVCGLMVQFEVWSQQPPGFSPAPSVAPPGAAVPVAAPPGGFTPHFDTGSGRTVYTWSSASPQSQSAINQLMKALSEADDDAKKTDITKKLEAEVAKQFDEDMKAREAELAKIEERLKKLTAQLERRRKAKSEIIELQIKVLINESAGLGFGSPSFSDAIPGTVSRPARVLYQPNVYETVPKDGARQ